jgi:hypothetical protein
MYRLFFGLVTTLSSWFNDGLVGEARQLGLEVEEPEEGLVFVGRQVIAGERFNELGGHGWVPLVVG